MKPNARGRRTVLACLARGGFVLGGSRIGQVSYCRRCDYTLAMHAAASAAAAEPPPAAPVRL